MDGGSAPSGVNLRSSASALNPGSGAASADARQALGVASRAARMARVA